MLWKKDAGELNTDRGVHALGEKGCFRRPSATAVRIFRMVSPSLSDIDKEYINTSADLTSRRAGHNLKRVDEITLQIQRDEDSGWLVASWDAPDGAGGITTQGQDLRDLQEQVTEAVAAYFDEGAVPKRIRLHFVSDPVLVQA